MEQKTYSINDYRTLQDTPAEPFKAGLRAMCRAAFGMDWTDRHPGGEAMDKLRTYRFLPEIFFALYEITGGEERLHQQGFLPIEKLEQSQLAGQDALLYCRYKKEEYAFCRDFSERNPPHHGLHIHILSPYSMCWEWTLWCSWGGQSQFQTLAAALLRQAGEALSREMPNCVWVKLPVKKEGKLSRYESLAKRLGVQALESVYPIGWEFLCDPDRGLLVRYCGDERKKVLVYSRDPAELEKLEWPVEWQRRNGKKCLDPEKFIQSPAPVTFAEKLEAMSKALLGKRSMALPAGEVEKAEARLGVKFPDALREFYLRFGKGGRLLTSDSLEDILTPKQMNPDNDDFGEEFQEAREQNSLLLAVENQGVWRLYLDCETGEPWMDWGEGRQDCWGLDLEGVLLYLLALNSVGFLPRGGECGMEDTPENRELLGHYFHFLTEGKMAVFIDPEKGLAGCRNNENEIYIKSHNRKVLDQLEENADIFVGEL